MTKSRKQKAICRGGIAPTTQNKTYLQQARPFLGWRVVPEFNNGIMRPPMKPSTTSKRLHNQRNQNYKDFTRCFRQVK